MQRSGYNPQVYVNGSLNEQIKVLEIERSEGGAKADHAVLTVDLAHDGQQYLQDIVLRQQWVNASIEILGFLVGGFVQVLHWGKVDLNELDISPDYGLRIVSRMQRWHFGVPLTFQYVADPESSYAPAINGEEVWFNPLIDGVIKGNMSLAPTDAPTNLFIHPNSIATQAAADYQQSNPFDLPDDTESGPNYWTLAWAVRYLCAFCNPAQTHIKNPTAGDLEAVFGTDAANNAIVRSVRLRPGLYLSEALDELLGPYGYTWTVDLLGIGQRKIRIFRRGHIGAVGVRNLALQRHGEYLNTTMSEVARAGVDCDAGAAFNKITVWGDYTKVEACWELIPAWPDSLDDEYLAQTITLADLTKDSPRWEGRPDLRRMGRDFVLNEAGDYIAEAGTIRPAVDKPADLTPYFREVWDENHPPLVARRRKFEPVLSLDGTGKPIGPTGGCTVQWFNPFGGEAISPSQAPPGAWEVLPQQDLWKVELLEGECGIRFVGDFPPITLLNAILEGQAVDVDGSPNDGQTARVRICATLASDTRWAYSTFPSAASVLQDTVEFTIDGGDRFHFQRRLDLATNSDLDGKESIYGTAGQTAIGIATEDQVEVPALECDGRAEMQAIAEALLFSWNQADIIGAVPLEGLDRSVQVGQVVPEISGRRIDLTASATFPVAYAQIVGIRWNVEQQSTVVFLRSFRDTDSYFAGLLGSPRKHLPGAP